jgi:hypothetical protein
MENLLKTQYERVNSTSLFLQGRKTKANLSIVTALQDLSTFAAKRWY